MPDYVVWLTLCFFGLLWTFMLWSLTLVRIGRDAKRIAVEKPSEPVTASAAKLSDEEDMALWCIQNGITFQTFNNGNHWKFLRDGTLIEWYPPTRMCVNRQERKHPRVIRSPKKLKQHLAQVWNLTEHNAGVDPQ